MITFRTNACVWRPACIWASQAAGGKVQVTGAIPYSGPSPPCIAPSTHRPWTWNILHTPHPGPESALPARADKRGHPTVGLYVAKLVLSSPHFPLPVTMGSPGICKSSCSFAALCEVVMQALGLWEDIYSHRRLWAA